MSGASTYRPWLDGVRAVAVLLVVLSHTAAPLPDFGNVGVGLFFGLSGYLITGLLLAEKAERGRVDLRRFYARRAARLVPALVLMLVVCNVLFLLSGRPEVLRSSVWALVYVANVMTIVQDGYLAGYSHTWSLAIEEHFYLVWPLVVVLLVRRRPVVVIARWALLVCALALGWRVVLAVGLGAGDLLLYHGTLERADALLYGCAAAAAVRAGWRPPSWLPWPCLFVLATLLFLRGTVVVTVGLALLGVASAGLAVGLDHAPGRLRAVLGSRPLAEVGLLSYGIYLWHYPLMRMADRASGPWAAAVAGLVITPLVAAASYYLLERRIRSWVRTPRHASSPPLDEAAGEGGFAGASEPR